jgi:hypothetical protein
LRPTETAVAETWVVVSVALFIRASGLVPKVRTREEECAADVHNLFEIVLAIGVLVCQTTIHVVGDAFAVCGADDIEPLQPFALIGLGESGRFGRDLSAEGLVSGGDGAIERRKFFVGTDGLLAWRFSELAVEALSGGKRRECEGEKQDVYRAHRGG